MKKTGHPLGLHRVIEPKGSLPQAAFKVDNTPEIYDNEILLDVEVLNITSASFLRLKKEAGASEESLARAVSCIIAERGKYQDPVLGSGGMLVGTVAEIGEKLTGRNDLAIGDRVATLVSLTATPLRVEKILRINRATDQVWVKGQAVIFERGLYARIPDDLPLEVSLAVMDVAGAPAMVAQSVKPGNTALVIGGGKAGLLCLHEARKRAGSDGKTIAAEFSEKRCREIQALDLADVVLNLDVTKPVDVMEAISEATSGTMADFTINVVNVENSEMASILATKTSGTVFFYNTATSFTKAALGAESVGAPVKMLIGNGYVPGHAELTFRILRENRALRRFFESIYRK
ncbi:MAG: L-erythro-3,5-diaminohexanoate dehydrogenase [Deltaproteobacteria bacterium]|nr:L-erythro-3,5-diaminohexanoate dehydrogenase [Deltaproteobacteria bacterium]